MGLEIGCGMMSLVLPILYQEPYYSKGYDKGKISVLTKLTIKQ
jgi:hypothetical protein